MVDREKAITGLELCTDISHDSCMMLCPYRNEQDETYSGFCEQVLKHDALALLREQETEWEHLWDAPDGTFKGRCKKCGFVHFFIEGHGEQYKFCPECGKAVKW